MGSKRIPFIARIHVLNFRWRQVAYLKDRGLSLPRIKIYTWIIPPPWEQRNKKEHWSLPGSSWIRREGCGFRSGNQKERPACPRRHWKIRKSMIKMSSLRRFQRARQSRHLVLQTSLLEHREHVAGSFRVCQAILWLPVHRRARKERWLICPYRPLSWVADFYHIRGPSGIRLCQGSRRWGAPAPLKSRKP